MRRDGPPLWRASLLVAGLLAATLTPSWGRDLGASSELLRVAIHVHSSYSTGDESLTQIAESAREHGLDAIIVTDDDLLEISYGLAPWRQLLRWTESQPALLQDGTLEAYLQELRRLDGDFEDLIIIDGVESAPYYTWDIDWSARQWTVRGWNRHLLAVGLDDAAAYRSLPVIGSEGMRLPQDGGSVLRMLWPMLGLLYAFWFGRRMHGAVVRRLLGGVCLLFLIDGGLQEFRATRFDPYVDAGLQPHQAWIDAVATAGGLAFWAHPEAASTIPARSIGAVASVVSATPAHAQDLLETSRYTGFAALYADNITATEPGRQWDQALIAYLRGERQRPVWGTGEIDYHRDEPGGRIHDIQTVVLATERSRDGVLQALARGRAYAVRGGDEALQLRRWIVSGAAGEAASGQLVSTEGRPWTVTAVLDKVNGQAEHVEVRLVRADMDGKVQVVADIDGMTPLHLEHVDTRLAPASRCYYRLLARSRTSKLTSNPIFVRGGE